jgi:transcription termination factor Rho
VPEDQESVTPRRRSRRQTPTQQTEPFAAEAQAPVAADSLAAQAPSAAAPTARRRTRRTPTGDTAAGLTEGAAAEASAVSNDGQPAAAPTQRRRASRTASEPSASGDQLVTSEDGTPGSGSKPRRASGPRVGRRRANAGAEAPATGEQAAPVAKLSAVRQSDTAAEAGSTPGSGASTGRPYRFGRAASSGRTLDEPAESQAAPAAETPAEQPAGEPSHSAPSEPAAEMAEPGPDGILRRTASDVGIRPLRRRWSNQEGRGREGIAPHIPGGQRGGQPQYPPGQGRAGGQHQPGRGPVPYSPGGRGQPAPSGQPSYAPGQNGGQGQNGTAAQQQQPHTQAGQPYGPYNPYEPYPSAYPGPQGAAGEAPPQGARRGRFGRYNEPRPARGAPPAPGRGPRQDLYREQGAPGRGVPSRGGVHPPHDRRFGGRGYGGRGTREQQQREYGRGYGPGTATAEPPYQLTPRPGAPTVEVAGLVWLGGGAGLSPAELLDGRTLQPVARINPEEARRLALRSGDELTGRAEERGIRKLLVAVETVNGQPVEEAKLHERPVFEQLTASFPDRRIRLEQDPLPVSARIIDLFAPLGFGSRALIVAPPKTGKTTLIREAAESVLKGYPDAVVMAVLVGERPEEVTDLRARLEPRGGLVFAASFDEDTQRHAWLVQVAVERAKRVAESGKDAFMVLDSLTRLARAENLASRGAGRTLSGGIDAQALDTGRRAFGAARNLEEGGSLTILATCLVDTGSRQDDVVYEEFKGTGNMELHLSRELSQRRLFPAIDAVKSGTRREEMLLSPDELKAATMLRRRLADLPPTQAIQQLLGVMEKTPSNAALISAIEASNWGTTVR